MRSPLRTARLVSHEEAAAADVALYSSMTREERLALGAELHAYWVRNYHPDATRLDRTVRVAQRPSR